MSTETNFIGRDPSVWWIGKVTDPKDGKVEQTLERTHMDDGVQLILIDVECVFLGIMILMI